MLARYGSVQLGITTLNTLQKFDTEDTQSTSYSTFQWYKLWCRVVPYIILAYCIDGAAKAVRGIEQSRQ